MADSAPTNLANEVVVRPHFGWHETQVCWLWKADFCSNGLGYSEYNFHIAARGTTPLESRVKSAVLIGGAQHQSAATRQHGLQPLPYRGDWSFPGDICKVTVWIAKYFRDLRCYEVLESFWHFAQVI